MSLADLGFTAEQELLYRAILRDPSLTADQLAAEHGLDRTSMNTICAGLVQLGVLKYDKSAPSGFRAPRPAAAIGVLIERREDELLRQYRRVSQSRHTMDELELLRRKPSGNEPVDDGVEVLENLQAVLDRLEELSFFTRTSVYSIQPGGPRSPEHLNSLRPLDQRSLRRGLDLRLLHEMSVLADETNRAYLHELMLGGAQVRVTGQKLDLMIIVDARAALIPTDPFDKERGALLIRQPGLVARFLDLFHRAWQDATELPRLPGNSEEPQSMEISEQDKQILKLLASGCTDETSARVLGLSVRHLRRTISRLMRQLGANSRFEAGVEAARRGWL
jgi:DNA-binding NarL/FixJ family response regulator